MRSVFKRTSIITTVVLFLLLTTSSVQANITETWALSTTSGSVGLIMKHTIEAGQTFRVGVQTHYGSNSWVILVIDPDGNKVGSTEVMGGVISLVAQKTGQYRIRLVLGQFGTMTGVSGYYVIETEGGGGTPNPTEPGPAAVSSMVPMGDLTTLPYYVAWNHVAKAQWYELWILGPNGFRFNQFYPASNADGTPYGQAGVCTDSYCAIFAPTLMSNGIYEMWIAAWGNNVWGPYHTQAFTFNLQATAPNIPQVLAPSQGELVTTTQANLIWSHQPGVNWYRVYVMFTDSGEVFDQWVAATEYDAIFYNSLYACNETTCAVKLSGNTRGLVRWWVGAWNPGGEIYTYENHFTFSADS